MCETCEQPWDVFLLFALPAIQCLIISIVRNLRQSEDEEAEETLSLSRHLVRDLSSITDFIQLLRDLYNYNKWDSNLRATFYILLVWAMETAYSVVHRARSCVAIEYELILETNLISFRFNWKPLNRLWAECDRLGCGRSGSAVHSDIGKHHFNCSGMKSLVILNNVNRCCCRDCLALLTIESCYRDFVINSNNIQNKVD